MDFDENNTTPRQEAITFSATGSEYFRIWIVNLLLSIVTLGIYSAWAKVRRNRYFYSSTHLAGSSFEYHGNAMAILKGRIAALVIFGADNLAFRVNLMAGLIMLAVMMAVMPWLIWKSLQFKLYNSSYRGIRFGFSGSSRKASVIFLALPLLNLLTLGLMTPFLHQRLKRFQHTESRFGSSHFSFNAPVGSFYGIYLKFIGMYLGGAVLATMLAAGLIFAVGNTNPDMMESSKFLPIALMGLVYLWMFFLLPYFIARLQNLVWNHTQLQGHTFESRMAWGRSASIYITNVLAIIFTLGLFVPFAHVRWMKYRLESMTMVVDGNLDTFVAATQEQVSAAGEGMVDLLDFDLSM